MCGRFAVDTETNDFLEELVIEHGASAIKDWQKYWPPHYNVAPTEQVAVARQHHGAREIASVRWGMVSASSPQFGGGRPIINARIETVASNGMFRKAFESRRCIVPALGYYEWQQREDGKQPFFVRAKTQLAMAGVVNAWRDQSKPEDDPDAWRLSMAIITLDSHVTPGEVHDRMPAFLTPDSYDDWLGDHLGSTELTALLRLTSAEIGDQLEYYPVSKAVNSVKNDGPELIERA